MIDEAPPSHSKASVLSELALKATLGDHHARAVELAREALAMAEELGLDDVRVRALNTIGVAGVKLGDRDRLADLERCLELAPIGSYEHVRALINLAAMHIELGDVARSAELHRRALDEAERFGNRLSIHWLSGELAFDEYLRGLWSEAGAHADEFIAKIEGGEGDYMETTVRQVRGAIRLARGETADGLADADRSLVLARAAEDYQVLYPSLGFQIHVRLGERRLAETIPFVDELLALLDPARSGPVAQWAIPLVIALTGLGRTGDFETVARSSALPTRWLAASGAYAAGEFDEAAGILADMGAPTEEAFVRLHAAEALVEAGRRAEADAQTEQALAFYRSVGATAYARKAESLFAASA